ncbi:hypothetical protein [Cyanobium sp. NIES-981]|uniref:hypothetical protein n=1 Tax=Cyanobium sp. NIES-981 TaxID=1851505 RepID=UPI0007DDC7CB|nr:hypothetical protein [Cyanobium sp. NIES-981]SBO43248.1 protein of unknown function [Cyanobium sp. NIES-981]
MAGNLEAITRDKRIFERAAERAAEAAGQAQTTGVHHQAEAHAYRLSQGSSNPGERQRGKERFCGFLTSFHGQLRQAYQEHSNAVTKGNHYYSNWNGQVWTRHYWAMVKDQISSLAEAQKGLDAHARAIATERRAAGCR